MWLQVLYIYHCLTRTIEFVSGMVLLLFLLFFQEFKSSQKVITSPAKQDIIQITTPLKQEIMQVVIIYVCSTSIFWFKYDLGQKYYAPQVRPNQGSNSWPPDHDSTFYVTETLIFVVQVWLRTEVLRTPSSTRLRFELITSRSWQYTSYITETPAVTTWPSVT